MNIKCRKKEGSIAVQWVKLSIEEPTPSLYIRVVVQVAAPLAIQLAANGYGKAADGVSAATWEIRMKCTWRIKQQTEDTPPPPSFCFSNK